MFYVTTALLLLFLSHVLLHILLHLLFYLLIFCKLDIMSLIQFWGSFFTSHKCNLIVNISFISNVLPFFMYSFISYLSFCIVPALVFSFRLFVRLCCILFFTLVFTFLFNVVFVIFHFDLCSLQYSFQFL